MCVITDAQNRWKTTTSSATKFLKKLCCIAQETKSLPCKDWELFDRAVKQYLGWKWITKAMLLSRMPISDMEETRQGESSHTMQWGPETNRKGSSPKTGKSHLVKGALWPGVRGSHNVCPVGFQGCCRLVIPYYPLSAICFMMVAQWGDQVTFLFNSHFTRPWELFPDLMERTMHIGVSAGYRTGWDLDCLSWHGGHVWSM